MDSYALLVVGQRRFVEPMVLALSKRYQVTACETRREALEHLQSKPVDLIVLDLASLRFDAHRFYEHVRKSHPTIPFVVLFDPQNKPERLPEAREYLHQPVDMRRLQRAIKRILPSRAGTQLTCHGLSLEVDTGNLHWGEKCVTLRPKTAALLAFLMQHPAQMHSRSELMQHVWNTSFDGDTRVVQVQVHWVRKALSTLVAPFEVRAVRGVGYGLYPVESSPVEPTSSA